MKSKFFSINMHPKDSNQILAAHFICTLFIDSIYPIEQKHHPERIRQVLALKPQTATTLLAEYKTQFPEKHDFFRQLELLFQSILQHFIHFNDNEFKKAMNLVLENNIVGINSLTWEVRDENVLEQCIKYFLYTFFLRSLAICGSIELLETIIKNQPDLINYEMEGTGISMLHVAIRYGNIAFVLKLIDLGVDVNKIRFNDPFDIEYPFYPTPLEFCLTCMLCNQTEDISNWKQLVDILLINGADPDKPTNTGSIKDFYRREYKNITNTEISAIFDKVNNWIMPSTAVPLKK